MLFFSRLLRLKVILMTVAFLSLIPCSSLLDGKTPPPWKAGIIKPWPLEVNGLRSQDIQTTIIHEVNILEFPESFDSRDKWPHCKSLQTILFQGECRGVWAFASSSVMSDRLCISTDGEFNEMLSVQDLLECCTDCLPQPPKEEDKGGCNGGDPIRAFKFWQEQGLVTGLTEYHLSQTGTTLTISVTKMEGCKPQFEGLINGTSSKQCRDSCTNPDYDTAYEVDKRFSVKTFHATPTDLRLIQAEIMFNGPVVGIINLDDSMLLVPPGTILIDDKTSNSSHPYAIKLIGWDVKDGIPVWTVVGSLSNLWCNNGFCHIRRGQNDFNLESNGVIGGVSTGDKTGNKSNNHTTQKPRDKSGSQKMFFEAILKYVALAFVFI